MSNYTLFVGTDQALVTSGVSVWCLETKTICVYKFTIKNSGTIYDRLLSIESQLQAIWKLADKYHLIQIGGYFAERPYYGLGVKTYESLVRVENTLIMAALKRGIPAVVMASGAPVSAWHKLLGAPKPKESWREKIDTWLPGECSLDESDSVGVLWGGLVSLDIVLPEELTSNDIFRISPQKGTSEEEFQNLLLTTLRIRRLS